MAVQAQRLQHIAPFHVVELLERAKALEAAGSRVVHLEVGEPDFATARPIVDAAHRALDAGATKYTQALGTPELRQRIARYYQETAGVDVAPERVVITAGASAGLLLLSALLLDASDELLLTDPGYPCNEVFVRLVNGVPVALRCRPENGFRIDPDTVRQAWGPATRGLLVASPANPTGAVLDAATLASLAAVVRANAGFLIVDEIYQGLTYGSNAHAGPRTALSVDGDMYVLNSFSKYFGMTGWRLGWMVVPLQDVEPVTRLAQNLFISPNSVSQHAALAAFSAEAMAVHQARRDIFERRLEHLCAGLEALGFTIPVRPGGAFYVYVDVSHTGLGAMDFCWRLLEEHHVAATPGIDFGTHDAERYVRFAFTTGEEDIQLGLTRLARALTAWGVA